MLPYNEITSLMFYLFNFLMHNLCVYFHSVYWKHVILDFVLQFII